MKKLLFLLPFVALVSCADMAGVDVDLGMKIPGGVIGVDVIDGKPSVSLIYADK